MARKRLAEWGHRLITSPWSRVVLLWATFVLLPDLYVRGRRVGPSYPLAALGSLVMWALAIAVVARVRSRGRVLLFAIAVPFAAISTFAVGGAIGYHAFFKKDVLSLEWQYALENPRYAWVLATESMTPVDRIAFLLAPVVLSALLIRVASASPALRRDAIRLHPAVFPSGITACATAMLFCRTPSADLVGLRAVVLGTYKYVVRGGCPRTLPPPRRVRVAAAPPRIQPDVLLIINESVRADALSSEQAPETWAFLQAHADRAVRFPHASSAATYTCVSVPTILTGLGPGAPRDDFATAPLIWQVARARGYKTALFSAQEYSIDFFSQYFLEADAPDVARTAPDYTKPIARVNEMGVDDALAVDAAIRFIDSLPAEQHFFMVLQFNSTHWPCWAPGLGVGAWRDGGSFRGLDPARCAAATRYVDEQASRLLAALQLAARLDEALVIATSDHGEVFRRDRPPRRSSFYDDVLAVPFWIHLPRALLDRASVVRENAEARVSNLDIYPTLLDVWGNWPQTHSPKLAGESLLRAIPEGRVLVSASDSTIGEETPGFAVFHGRWKWVVAEQLGAQLFDLHADPGEEHDLAAYAPPEELRVLRGELVRRPELLRMLTELAPGFTAHTFPDLAAPAASKRWRLW